MDEYTFKTDLSMKEIEDNFKKTNFFEAENRGLEEASTHENSSSFVEAVNDNKPSYKRPLCLDELSEEQLAEELEKGLADIRAGRVYSADEVFESIINGLLNNGDKTNEHGNN